MKSIGALRTRQRGHPNGGCACLDQGLACGARRGSGSQNVIDDENILRRHARGIGDRECTTYIEAALARSEPGLTFRSPLAEKRTGCEREPPLGMALAQKFDRRGGQRTGLIESALREF